MFFRSLFKPKWQHRNPAVRRQAVAALDAHDSETAAVLAQVARSDQAAEVRSEAVRRLADLDLLQELSRTDPDQGVRELADHRYCQLLAGNGTDAPPYAERAERLRHSSDARIVELVARHGREPELRLAALERVERDALLGNIAIDDPDPRVRLAAVERVKQRSTLDRVFQTARSRDKRVSRRARERIAQMDEEVERPRRLLAQRDRICSTLETLGKNGRWEQELAMLGRLEGEWTALEGDPGPELSARFELARGQFLSALEIHRASERERQCEEEMFAPLRAQKKTLCATAEGLLQDLRQRATLDAEQERTVAAALDTLRASWAQVDRLPLPEELLLESRFAQLREEATARCHALVRYRETSERLREVLEQARALLEGTAPVTERAIQGLERRWQAIEQPAGLPDAAALERGFRELLQALGERMAMQRKSWKRGLETLTALVAELVDASESGELKRSKALLEQAQAGLRELAGSPHPIADLEARLQAASARVRQLQDWQHWANTREKERLCAEVEALIGREDDPLEIDRLIREARAAWKRAAASEPEAARVLWERFNDACTRAYEPCRIHFEAQAQERAHHLAAKEALCERLERLNAETDWTQVGGKAIDAQVRAARQEWMGIGPVDRKRRNALDKRFNAAIEALLSHAQAERERNRQQKLLLVQRVEALAQTQDLREAVQQAKSAQAEWKTLGPAPRGQDRELWQRFRAACDAVFARRQQRAEALEAERQATLARKLSLCTLVEDLAALEGPDLLRAAAQVRQAQAEWQQLGPAPKEAAEAVSQRFKQACERYFARHRAYQEALRREQAEGLQRKAALCAEVEALLEAEVMEDQTVRAERVEAARTAWSTVAPLEREVESAIQERFDKACRAALTDGDAAAALSQELRRHIAAKETLCIRMEILAGVESPPEAAEARLRYQVERLARGLGQEAAGAADTTDPRALAAAIERSWYLTGALPAVVVAALEQRFQTAKAVLDGVAQQPAAV